MSDLLYALRAAVREFRRTYRRRVWLRQRAHDTTLPF